MATSLYFIETFYYYTTVRIRCLYIVRIHNRIQSCAEWTEQHGTSSCLYNHDGFNSPTETEKEKWFAFILRSTGASVSAVDSETCAPNVLSALANKAFKVIVSCLTVWWTGQASTGFIYLKTVSSDKTSRCYDAIFYSVALVQWFSNFFRRRPPCVGWIILWPPKRKLMTKTSSNLQVYV